MIHLRPAEAAIFFHLLAFFLIVLAPVLGWYIAARIKSAPSTRARLLGYRLAIAFMLAAVAAVFLLVPPGLFFDIQLQNRGVAWLPSRELISVLAIALVLMTALPVLLARKGGSFQVTLQEQVHALRSLLPQTSKERLWFALTALCAGVCEEFLYRGFLLHYLHVFPWRVNIGTSLVISCAVFALVHLYQGVSGVLQTVLLALGLSVLFLSTRSLLAPIVLHVLIEMRIFLVLPRVRPATR